MRDRRSRLAVFGALALALTITAGLIAGNATAKKLKPFSEQLTVGTFIPDFPAVGAAVPVISTIEVSKKYKKRKVADVNVTNLQTTGATADAADDLKAKLTAPGGRTVLLFDTVGSNQANLGPWTLDDDTFVSICSDTATPPCDDPTESLNAPYAGTSNLIGNDQNSHGPGAGPLSNFDGVNMRGTWTLRIWDEANGAGNGASVFQQWGLEIKPLKLKPPTVEVD